MAGWTGSQMVPRFRGSGTKNPLFFPFICLMSRYIITILRRLQGFIQFSDRKGRV